MRLWEGSRSGIFGSIASGNGTAFRGSESSKKIGLDALREFLLGSAWYQLMYN